MTKQHFDFSFPSEGLGAPQGPISPAEEFFKGSSAQSSVARETIQNSLDASAHEGPARVTFELQLVETADIPGFETLRTAIEAAGAAHPKGQGSQRLRQALSAAAKDRLHVLRIGDYGTVGLAGTESKADRYSPLNALTRGTGISSDDGSRGGSFGIGSAVGPMASDISTVLYTSRTKADSGTVFAGYSRLASHQGPDGEWRSAEGFFRNVNRMDDFEYMRNWNPFAPFMERTEPGTDVYVLGYFKADQDRGLHHLRDAVLENFLVAIARGRLEVNGVTPHGEWNLAAESLEATILHSDEARDRVLPFYRALMDNEPVKNNLPGIGNVELYISDDSSLPKSLGTWTMRKPLMRVDTFSHRIPYPYAAILICADEPANSQLRELEPPEHNKWDPERRPGGRALLQKLKAWVRVCLRNRFEVSEGDRVQVDGLERFLPQRNFPNQAAPVGSAGRPNEPVDPIPDQEESGSRSGAVGPATAAQPQVNRPTRVSVQRPATGRIGGARGRKGKDRGGTRKRNGGPPRIPDGVSPGTAGKSRIAADEVDLRTWYDHTTQEIVAAISSEQQIEGDLALAVLGPDGNEIRHYHLEITAARILEDGSWKPLNFGSEELRNLTLEPETTTKVRIATSRGQRFRIGVKDA